MNEIDKIVIAKEDWGDDLIFLEKGKKYKAVAYGKLAKASSGRKRVYLPVYVIRYGNKELPFPAKCFYSDKEIHYMKNPLFGRF